MAPTATNFRITAAALVSGIVLAACLVIAARAETNTQCRGARCVGSDCTWDGDAHKCWQEAVIYRQPGERLRWVCDRWDETCQWVQLPYDYPARHHVDYGGY